MPTPVKTSIVVCGILKAEVEASLRQQRLDVPVLGLAPAPCIDYTALERQLHRTLSRAKKLADRVLVVIGLCHPDIDRILREHGAGRLDVRDCFEALLGRQERRRLDDQGNTFYTLPSWLAHWRRAFRDGMRWDQAEVRQNFARYERILMLDSGLHHIDDEKVLELFDYTGVPIEVRAVGLEALGKLLAAAVDAKQEIEV